MMTTEAAQLLTVAEVADRLRLHRHTVYALLDSGAIDGVYIGRRRMVSVPALNAYVAGLSSTPAAREATS